jgi:hypothetical protein
MSVIKKWTVFGHTFTIEALATPVLKGATTRHYRLYDNGVPATGMQWHARLEDAIARADYILQCSYVDRIAWLEQRVNALEHELARRT